MRAIKCEMCGSTNLIKMDGEYVCEFCGTRYSVEEAKKLLVEIEGEVKIDHSQQIASSLQNGRRAKEKEDWEECEKYYNMVEQYDPSNIEAIFYSSYGKARRSLVDPDIYKREAEFKPLINSVSILDENFQVDNIDANMQTIMQISDDIISLVSSSFVYTTKKNGYGVIVEDQRLQTVTLFNRVGGSFCDTLEQIAAKLPDANVEEKLVCHSLAIKHAEYILKHGSLVNPQVFQDALKTYHARMHELDPSHEVPQAQVPTSSANTNAATSGLGEYVVTVVLAIIAFALFAYALA